MKLTQKQLRRLIEQTVSEAPRRRPGGARTSLGFSIPEESPDYGKTPGGTIKLMFEVEVDAEDLVNENGIENATDMLRGALAPAADDVRDLLMDNMLEVNGVPVAVRNVRVV